MSSVKFSLDEVVLLTAPPEVLVFLIRQLESEKIKLQAALNDSDQHISSLEDKCRSLRDQSEQMLDQKLADMLELHQKIVQEEAKVRKANEDLAEAIIYNCQLEAANGELQHEIRALKDRLFEEQLTGH